MVSGDGETLKLVSTGRAGVCESGVVGAGSGEFASIAGGLTGVSGCASVDVSPDTANTGVSSVRLIEQELPVSAASLQSVSHPVVSGATMISRSASSN